MTPRDSSPEPQNALLRRVQQYAAATAVFRKLPRPSQALTYQAGQLAKQCFCPAPALCPLVAPLGKWT
ncbi:MAG: hypothetical protein M5U34_05050 [Chloroflexi bacterium]|nr:hypothetical protein [Chloroflexota bacterium]